MTTMIEKLEPIIRRYEEIETAMADPDVVVNYERVQELAKEQALADHARHRAEIDLLTGGRLALPNLQMKDDSHEILVE